MRKHIVLLIIGLLAVCALFLALRGCNAQNAPAWAMQGVQALFGPDDGSGQMTDQKADASKEIASIISQSSAPAPSQTINQSALSSKAPLVELSATPAPSSLPTAQTASQGAIGAPAGLESESTIGENVTPDLPSDTQAPDAAETVVPADDPDAAVLPADTTVMDGDTAERSEEGTAFERELFNTKPMIQGDDVKLVQTALRARGFSVGEVDGKFGPKTEKAVKAYQLYHQIHGTGDAAYGHVDETTWNWLF